MIAVLALKWLRSGQIRDHRRAKTAIMPKAPTGTWRGQPWRRIRFVKAGARPLRTATAIT
jgi:hypothetical protein